jgi:hypothetical protein
MGSQPIYWKMRNGKSISIDDMDVNHLRNTLKMIVKNSNKHKDNIEKEAYWKKQNEKTFLNGDMAQEFNNSFSDEEYAFVI